MSKALLAVIAAIILTLPLPALAQLTWGTNGSGGAGTWNSTNTNWYNGTSNVAWVSGDVATFPGISSLAIVTVSGTQTASELIFSPDSGSGEYLFKGGSIQGTVTGLIIQIDPGAQPEINSDLTGGPVTVQGTGTLATASRIPPTTPIPFSSSTTVISMSKSKPFPNQVRGLSCSVGWLV